jgi:hypothetical protein
MKSKLFNSPLDLLLDIIVWLMREKDDHPTVPAQSDSPTRRKPAASLAADGFMEKERNQDGGQTT